MFLVKFLITHSEIYFMKDSIILTLCQAADILQISENTLITLTLNGQVPYIKMPNSSGTITELYFNSIDLVKWYNNLKPINTNIESQVVKIKKQINKQPDNLLILKDYDKKFKPKKKSTGFCLQKVPNKKLGFKYYVRFVDKGIVYPKRTTHTNNYELAFKYATEMRETFLIEKRTDDLFCKSDFRLYSIMSNFYKKNSIYQKANNLRNKPLCDHTRQTYHNMILLYWIPFLKKFKITELKEINQQTIIKFQDYCSSFGMKPQSVNHCICHVSRIFDYLLLTRKIQINPCKGIKRLYVDDSDVSIRDCYNVDELSGVFNKRWKNELYYLLCLIIYSTGMRNSEIERIKVKDIITINGCYFIDIPKSKSRFGIRIVPLHNFIYSKLLCYIRKTMKGNDDILFNQSNGRAIPRQWYRDANIMLGMFTRNKDKKLDYKEVKQILKNENISFYSGRHWYKTVLNAHDLGDVEEYFMGHRVTHDVSKRYNHRDKQGQEILVKKAKEVFKILDKLLFANNVDNEAKKLICKKRKKIIGKAKKTAA